MSRFLGVLLFLVIVGIGCLPNPQIPEENSGDDDRVIIIKDSIIKEDYYVERAIFEEVTLSTGSGANERISLNFGQGGVAAAPKALVSWRRSLATLRSTMSRWVDVIFTDSSTGEDKKIVFDLSSQGLSRDIILAKGKYYLRSVFWHGIHWDSLLIKEAAFIAYDTIDCRSASEVINLSFVERDWMVAFVRIPGAPGKYVEGKKYRTATSSSSELKEAFNYQGGVLNGWVLVDLDREVCDVRLFDEDSIVNFSFYYSIDLDNFDSTWELTFGGIGNACDASLDLLGLSFYGDCVTLDFNVVEWMRVLSWKVSLNGDTANIGGYIGPRSGFLCWTPPGGNSFVFESGDKYYFTGVAFPACGPDYNYSDSITIP